MNDLIYNGISLYSLGFAVAHFPVHSVARRDLEFKSVWGRSGDLIADNQRFLNVDMPPYEINTLHFSLLPDKEKLERALIDWLMTGDGSYKILEDRTKPGLFTYAICTEIGELVTNNLNGYLSTTLHFNRCPFWFRKDGQKAIEWTGNVSQHFNNPEPYTALPVITIEGEGYMKLTVNGVDYDIYLSQSNPRMVIDCENMHAYNGNTVLDSNFSGDYFPTLRPGHNTVRVWTEQSATIGACSIVPNWRRL